MAFLNLNASVNTSIENLFNFIAKKKTKQNKKLTVSVSTSLLFSKTEMNSSVKEMNKQSPGEEGQMADKHMKRCST